LAILLWNIPSPPELVPCNGCAHSQRRPLGQRKETGGSRVEKDAGKRPAKQGVGEREVS